MQVFAVYLKNIMVFLCAIICFALTSLIHNGALSFGVCILYQ